MKNRVLESEDFNDREEDTDVSWILQTLQLVSNEMGTDESVYYAQHEALKRFYTYYQNFKELVAVVEHYGGNIFCDISLIKYKKKK